MGTYFPRLKLNRNVSEFRIDNNSDIDYNKNRHSEFLSTVTVKVFPLGLHNSDMNAIVIES